DRRDSNPHLSLVASVSTSWTIDPGLRLSSRSAAPPRSHPDACLLPALAGKARSANTPRDRRWLVAQAARDERNVIVGDRRAASSRRRRRFEVPIARRSRRRARRPAIGDALDLPHVERVEVLHLAAGAAPLAATQRELDDNLVAVVDLVE